MGTRIYEYGLLPPTVNRDVVLAQMRAGHKYANTLIEIERERRGKHRAIDAEYPEVSLAHAVLQDAVARVETLRATMRAQRAATKVGRAIDIEITTAQVKTARDAAKQARLAWRDARKRFRDDPLRAEALAAAADHAHTRHLAERAATETYWGTYLKREASHEQACETTSLYDETGAAQDPRWRRWMGDGYVAIHQVKPRGLVAALESNTALRIMPVPEDAWSHPSRGYRRRAARTTLWMRVGSQDRAPVWAHWPMIYHRPLPPRGRIKNAAVFLRHEGPAEIWCVQITVDEPQDELPVGAGVVGIDVGWRIRGLDDDGSLRVAVASGEDGAVHELRLSSPDLDALTYPDHLRSIRDTRLDELRAMLVGWIGGAVAPQWFRDATTHLHQWRAPRRFAALYRHWGEQRWKGDESAYEALAVWVTKDRHLWHWESAQRGRAIRRRRDIYRRWAATLADRYEAIAVENFDRRRVAVKPATEDGTADTRGYDRLRVLAATSVLSQALKAACSARGRDYLVVEGAYTTRICHGCGHTCTWPQDRHVVHQCDDCGATWDQDANAAINLRERGREALAHRDRSNGGNDAGSEQKGGRWSRRKAEKAAKSAARNGSLENLEPTDGHDAVI